MLAILPPRANGQFGIDTVAILAALSKMQSLMNTYIATPLKTINQYEQSATESYTPVNSLSDRSALGPLNRFSQQHKFTMSGGLGLWNAG